MRALTLSIVAASLLVTASVAPARKQTRAQQRCVMTLLVGGFKVAGTQGVTNSRCVRDPGPGQSLTACLAENGRATSAVNRLAANTLVSCTKSPADFGVPNAFEETVSEAAIVHERGLLMDLFGADPDAAVIGQDEAGAECQAKVIRSTERVMRDRQRAFFTCVKKALRKGARDAAALDPCVGTRDEFVSHAENKVYGTLDKRCEGVDLPAAFPGICSGPTDLGSCLVTRTACRACRLSATMAALDVDCDLIDDRTDNDSCRFPVSLSGDAIDFFEGFDSRIAGARIAILEHPEREVITSANGAFLFEDLEEGEEVTLTLDKAGYHPIQTGTIRLGAAGATRVTFQAVTDGVYTAFGAILGIIPDEENRCQMVTTVTRVGKSIYDPGAHGEAGVTVTTSPELPAEHGPIYFNASVIPDPSLSETSEDGGSLYIQVPPGEYVWTARKRGTMISRIKQKCRAGFLVNASPPWGLQTHAAPPPAK
jgi:hypothetical protein